jgi:hypothetical protein
VTTGRRYPDGRTNAQIAKDRREARRRYRLAAKITDSTTLGAIARLLWPSTSSSGTKGGGHRSRSPT